MIVAKKLSEFDNQVEKKLIQINTLTPNLKFNNEVGKEVTAINTYISV